MKTGIRLLTLAVVLALALSAFAAAPAKAQKLSGKLEIMSWWVGDEAPALDALVKLYKTQNPDVDLQNSGVAGGSGVAAKAVLKTRMLGGNPPDSFQVHAGQELIGSWVKAGRMEPLNDLFKSEGWTEKFPKGLIELLSTPDGNIWSVPVNIHRSNVMWFVPDNLKKWGVEVPKTWDDFLKTCDTLKKANVTALALGPTWTAVHLYENVLLSQLGADDYKALFAGKLKWTDPKVVKVWDLYGKILDCTNSDAASLGDWVPAGQLVLDGKAAFNVMGDWWAGWAVAVKKLEPGKGFGWAVAPGTDGIFNMLSDSFGLPKSIKNKDNAVAWLKLLGSVEGQDAFNPLKGSIAARLDSDPKKYNAYSQTALKDWQSAKVVGSLWHGAAAPEGFVSTFATIMEVFIGTRNADLASAAAQQLAVDSGMAAQ